VIHTPSFFKPDRWTVTVYWKNPPTDELPPYASREWTHYEQDTALHFARSIKADFAFVRAWEGHTGRLILNQTNTRSA